MVCYYALGKSYDKLEDTAQAFDYYVLANKLQKKLTHFKTSDLAPFYEKIITHNTQALIDSADHAFKGTITPVFIIGMPRSGSTLLEQMMANHSQFATLGENTSIGNQVVGFIEQQTHTSYPECLSLLTNDLIAKARNIYIDELKKAQPIRPFIINKLPSNYQSLGLIYLLFPNAKFINLSRDFNATAFSVFSNYFAENEPYFCDLKDFKFYHGLYLKLMQHWRSLPSLPVYDIYYEQLVEEPQAQLSALFGFLGCKHESQCLAFYKRKAAVSTLSKQAIRQPINTQAIAHWERYKAPLLKQFE